MGHSSPIPARTHGTHRLPLSEQAAFASVAGRRAKNSGQSSPGSAVAAGLHQLRKYRSCRPGLTGTLSFLVGQKFLLKPHPKLIFGFQRGAPLVGRPQTTPHCYGPKNKAHASLGSWAPDPHLPHYSFRRGQDGTVPRTWDPQPDQSLWPHLRGHCGLSPLCVWSLVMRFGLGGTQTQCHEGHTDSQMSKARGGTAGT